MAKLDEKKKCKKFPFADVLKWAIFSLVMLAPFFAVLSKMCYVTFNPNAKESYSQNYITKAVKINNNTTAYLIEHNELTFINLNTVGTISTDAFYWYTADYDFNTEFNLDFVPNGLKFSNNNNAGTRQYYMFHNPDSNTWTGWIPKDANTKLQFNFELKSYDNAGTGQVFYDKFNIIYNYEAVNSMDNVFYDSINELNEQAIFSWTRDTAMYTAIDNMTTDLEINTNGNILATILTYWTLNTAIYLIFDVVIHFSTKLVHMFSGE